MARQYSLLAICAAALCASAASSAIKSSSSSSSCSTPQQDIAFSGYDLEYSLNADGDLDSCIAACQLTPFCTAVTLYPNGRCFSKSAVGTISPSVGSVSCNITTNTSPSTCPLSLIPCNTTGACALFLSTCDLNPSCGAGNILCPDGTCLAPSSTTGWSSCPSSSIFPYMNISLSLDERVDYIVNSLSIDEIAPQLNNRGYGAGPPGPPSIPRLYIAQYNYLNEGLHGVARSGLATSFPQISVAGNTWNRTAWFMVGKVLGLEARVKHLMYRRANDTGADYTGVTYYAPNINIGRDARWGRIQEVPTEDPTIMSAYAAAVTLGAQSTSQTPAPPAWLVDPSFRGTKEGIRQARTHKPMEQYITPNTTSAIVACCKHAVAYSVEEFNGVPRAGFNAIVSGEDMLDTYFPAFQSCFVQGGGQSSMCSYNAVQGVPTCSSAFLLNTTIRQRYGRGDDTFIVSDYSAIQDTYTSHHYCPTADPCVAGCLIAGTDQDGGGGEYGTVANLIEEGLLTDEQVRTAASRLFRARVSLGTLNQPQDQPFVDELDAPSVLDSDYHRQLSLEAATQGIVLLSNPSNTLPLKLQSLKKVSVLGPNADVPQTLYGNYQGTPPYLITPRQAFITALGGSNSSVYYAPGCSSGVSCNDTSGFADAIAAASQPDADAVIVVLGIDQTIEAEGHDRVDITLPGNQIALLQAVCAAAKAHQAPCIVVYINGGPIAESWPLENADAVVLLGYASQSAGTALVNVLLGNVSPAGKLAVTWPASVEDLPSMGDMGMRPNSTSGNTGRTYRFTTKEPLIPFGFGLTYTSWSYTNLVLPTGPVNQCDGVPMSVTLKNTGTMDSSEVVQVYISWSSSNPPAGAALPAQQTLVEFERVFVPAGGSIILPFTITSHALALVNSTTAANFGQDFAMSGPEKQAASLSGEAYGVETNYYALNVEKNKKRKNAHGEKHAARSASPASSSSPGVVIGWDDMFFVPTGTVVNVWVGSSQPPSVSPQPPGGAIGAAGTFTFTGTSGGGVNLAVCDLQL